MARMPVVPVGADLEAIAALEPQAAVDAGPAEAAQRDGLVEQLHAGTAAQVAREGAGTLARLERAQPQRDRGADEKQGNPLGQHRPSVETPVRPCKDRSDRQMHAAGSRSRRAVPISLESPYQNQGRVGTLPFPGVR